MPRPKSAIASYLLYKPTGQARCRIGGHDNYLGVFGSEESRRRYGDLVCQSANNLPVDPIAPATPQDSGPSVAELVLVYLRHAATYYVKDGKPTGEVHCFRSAVKSVVTLFGMCPAKDFGPLQLQTVRTQYLANGWTRRFCKASVNRLRRIWKWGVSQALVPVASWQGLTAVGPLKAGK